jgi:glycosyltransferase involved in cell wall biosynthesis
MPASHKISFAFCASLSYNRQHALANQAGALMCCLVMPVCAAGSGLASGLLGYVPLSGRSPDRSRRFRGGYVKISILIPVYNERATLREILRRVRAVDLAFDKPLYADTPLLIEKEIVVVDDGSTDGSQDILRQEEAQGDLIAVLHAQNQGKGAAVRTAIAAASGDILLIQDADLEYDPRDFPALIMPIIEGRADVVYGSRFLGGPRKAMLFWHMIANKLITLMTNILYDAILSDVETCYKAFRADVIKTIPLRSKRFEIEPEITAKVLKRGYRIYEVPISYTGREYQEGKKIGMKDAFEAVGALMRYRLVD